MKLNKFLLMGAVFAAAVSCSDKDEINNGGNDPKGNTYSSVSIKVKKDGLRALDGTQGDNVGTDAEHKVANLKMLSTAGDASWEYAATPGADNTFWSVGTVGIGTGYQTAPWQTQQGNHTMALIFNANSIDPGVVSSTGSTLYEGEVTDLINPNFTMTSAAFSKNIKPNITKEEAAAGTGEDFNVFTGIEVERVVSKGIVRQASNFSNQVKQGETVVATVSDLSFAAVNGATKAFLFKDNAGERTMTELDNNLYTDFKSAIHDIAPVLESDAAYAAGLVRLGATGVSAAVKDAKEVNAANAAPNNVDTKVFYFLENSGELTPENKEQGYYRFAYAKVYATYHPAKVLVKDGEAQDLVPKAGMGTYYKDNGNGTYAKVEEGDEGAVEGYLVFKIKEDEIAEGVTFYKGVEDGLLYGSKEAAASSRTAPGQKAYTYTNGRAGYRALWNRQIEDNSAPNVLVNVDTRRNNAYVLDITAFAGLGFPWDESDPTDPNLPKPDEDDDPDLPNPTDPNIEPEETYMRVEAVVLPWNLVVREGIVLQ